MNEYKDEHGNIVFRIYINLRSSLDPKIRVQRRADGILTKSEAEKIHKRLMSEARYELARREHAGMLWSEVVDRWEVALRSGRGIPKKLEATTAHDYIAALRIYTRSWMKKPIKEITPADFELVMISMEADGKSNSRKKAIRDAVNGAFRFATQNRLVNGNLESPTTGTKIERKEKNKPEILTRAEIVKLLWAGVAVLGDWFYVVAVALLTGMRSGELFALEWSDVDFEGRMLTCSKSYNGRLKKVKCTKGGYWRDIPINDDLMVLLKELKLKSAGSKHVLPRIEKWRRGEAARVLRHFCVGLGITPVKFHALRACFATQLLRDKVAPVVVMKICGWTEVKTMQRYIRLAGIETDGATDSLKLLTPKEAMGRVVELYKK